MRKIASFGLAIGFAAAAVAVWAKPSSVTSQGQPIAEATISISPHEMHLQADLTNLPDQTVADLI
jgi:hypothetical protein